MCSNAPPEAEALLKEKYPNDSIASWALRFTFDFEGVITVLSGMSTIEQMRENIEIFKNPRSLTKEDKEILEKVITIYKQKGPYKTSDFTKYEKLKYHGVPVSTILNSYNSVQIQPRPDFSCDNTYFRNRVLEDGHFDIFNGIPKQKVVMDDGTDITEMVEEAVKWMSEHIAG